MIKREELLKKVKEEDLTDVQKKNLPILLERLNKLRTAYGKPLSVSSGVRDMKDHLRIYAEKGITDQSKIPMKSKHLSAEAGDLVAKDIKHFQQWIKDNEDLMEEIGLWFEDFSVTLTWVHAQIVPPRSNKRFFLP